MPRLVGRAPMNQRNIYLCLKPSVPDGSARRLFGETMLPSCAERRDSDVVSSGSSSSLRRCLFTGKMSLNELLDQISPALHRSSSSSLMVGCDTAAGSLNSIHLARQIPHQSAAHLGVALWTFDGKFPDSCTITVSCSILYGRSWSVLR